MAAGTWMAEFAFLPIIGLEATMRVGVLAAAGAGVAVWWRSRAPKLRRAVALSPAVAALLIAVLLPAWPREVFAAGIGFIAPRLGPDETLSEIVKRMQLLYYRDGRRATISVDETGQLLPSLQRQDGGFDRSRRYGQPIAFGPPANAFALQRHEIF